ncbi:restriction endonuclease subunit S [Paracoccus sp. PARArs4]|uniref:restriction endonuclease subunit S n=1 Tax=Paracoccus sp. PARArs4 TaxID=2853442 RepID=UPI0024A6E91F|nr:restriction endonuclease subunit S [Paracoccus sp. PARArs4]
MNAERLLDVYEQISEAPDAIARLRRFVLDLAVRGKLVEQDVADEPAQEFLKKVRAEKARLTQAGVLRKSKALKPINVVDHAFGIPTSWSWARLGDLTDLVSGQHLQPAEYSEDPEAGIPYITGPSDFGDKKLVIRRYALVRKAVATKGQLLLTVKGSGVGKTAPCDLDEVAISRQLMALTPILLNADFLALVAHGLATKLQDEARSLIPGISRDDVNLFAVAVPPLAEQHRIVAKVDELMGLCDRLEEARKTREEVRDKLTAASLARLTAPDTTAEDFSTHAAFALEALPALTTRPDQIKILRQTILNLAVRGKLVEQDAADEPISLDRSESAAGTIALPPGWRCTRLVNLLSDTTRNGYSRRPDDAENGTPILRISAGTVRQDGVVAEEEHKLISGIDDKAREQYGLRQGDLLACRFNGNKAYVGRLTLFNDYLALNPIYPDKLIRVRVDRGRATPEFIRMAGESDLVRAFIEEFCATTVGNWGISASNLKEVVFPVPPLAEQHRIVAKVDALMALCDRLEAALTTTDTTRTRLLEALLHETLHPAATALEAAE